MANKRLNRVDIKQISRLWVSENCQNITERDMKLLKILYGTDKNRREILRRDQIEAFMPGAFASTDRLNKRLLNLYNLHVIDRIQPQVATGEGSSKQHICIDKAGAILMDMAINPYIKYREGVRYLPMHWRHKVKLNDYEIMMRRMAKAHCYETEQEHTFHDRILQRDKTIKPDIFTILQGKNGIVPVFIEVDLGTEDLKTLKEKVHNYAKYRSDGRWQKLEWQRYFTKPTFPDVLFFTEDNRYQRVEKIQEYMDEWGLPMWADTHSNAKGVIQDLFKG